LSPVAPKCEQTTQSARAVQYLSESFESFAYIYFMAFNRAIEAVRRLL
jgi:hypothetical protein